MIKGFSPQTKKKLHDIIFEANTPSGKLFDIILLYTIVISLITIVLESIHSLQERYILLFHVIEWIVTIIFTIEYILRLMIVRRPWSYAKSFFGVIDLLSILPSYISLLIPGSQFLMAIRILRLLRVFRIFKLGHYIKDSFIIIKALRESRYKITVFLITVLLLVFVLGSVMYVIEGHVNEGFDNIPRAVYWAIITLTTVGYGDIIPITPAGQFIASIVMILGYAIIAVPTGIVTASITRHTVNIPNNSETCPYCMKEGHVEHATFCYNCGQVLNQDDTPPV